MTGTVIRRVNSRFDASTAAKKAIPLEVGSVVDIVGLKYGEKYRGSNMWFADAKGLNYTSHAISVALQGNTLAKLIDFPALWQISSDRPIKIGIFDSGVSNNAQLFGTRVIQLNHNDETIVQKHADYMATIIAGSDLRNGYVGFLPNANIFSYQASKGALGSAEIVPEDILSALKMFVDIDVDIINISMSTDDPDVISFFQNNSEIKQVFAKIRDKEIAVTAAAGNFGLKSDDHKFFPAGMNDIISVSGYKFLNEKPKFDFSWNLWSDVKILAPSFPIYDTQFFKSFQVSDSIGTSVSSAVSAGLLGALKALHGKQADDRNFLSFVSEKIESMPTVVTPDEIREQVKAPSFKCWDFKTVANILNI